MVQNSNDRSRRQDGRRQEILRAAARAFRRHGFAATGMRDIAAEADLSPGNLYYYFAGKHELLYYCQDKSLDRMLAAVQAARLSGLPIEGQLQAVLHAHALCLLDAFEGSVAHLEVEALPDEPRRAIIDKRDRYERAIRRLVSRGMREGVLRAGDASLITRSMLGAINWTARWFRPDGPRSATAVADELVDFLIRGARTDRGADDSKKTRNGERR